jgi:hypothetical protein
MHYPWDGTLEAIHHRLYLACRAEAGKDASPSAAILDSKSVKAAEKGASTSIRSATTRASRASNALPRVKGVKYHVLVDTLGLLLNVVVHAADIQDRDGAALVLDRHTRALFPFIAAIFAQRLPRRFAERNRLGAASRRRGTPDWRLAAARRQALRHRPGLHGAAQALDRGADSFVAHALSPPCAILRTSPGPHSR